MGFWAWHKKFINNPEPVFGFNYQYDEHGNKDFKMFFGKNKIHTWKHAPVIESRKTKQLQHEKDWLLE